MSDSRLSLHSQKTVWVEKAFYPAKNQALSLDVLRSGKHKISCKKHPLWSQNKTKTESQNNVLWKHFLLCWQWQHLALPHSVSNSTPAVICLFNSAMFLCCNIRLSKSFRSWRTVTGLILSHSPTQCPGTILELLWH